MYSSYIAVVVYDDSFFPHTCIAKSMHDNTAEHGTYTAQLLRLALAVHKTQIVSTFIGAKCQSWGCASVFRCSSTTSIAYSLYDDVHCVVSDNEWFGSYV